MFELLSNVGVIGCILSFAALLVAIARYNRVASAIREDYEDDHLDALQEEDAGHQV